MLSSGRFTGWSPLRHLWLLAMAVMVVVVFSRVSKGSACEAPGNPHCFRTDSRTTQYICEWSRSTSGSNVTYDLLINTTTTPHVDAMKKTGLTTNRTDLDGDTLNTKRHVYIVVTAHMGNSSCSSTNPIVMLENNVKFPAPQNTKASWSDHKLKLTWTGQGEPASVDVLVRRLENETQTWTNITNKNKAINANDGSVYCVLVEDLQRQTVYQVQVRQRPNSTQFVKAWSDWSSTLTVPAEIEHTPEIELKTNTAFENGTRLLVFTWKAVPPAARVGGVNYTLTNPRGGCLCSGRKETTVSTNHSIYVTNSAVNFSFTAINMAGSSTPKYVYVQAKPANLKVCGWKNCEKKVPKGSCVEWYEFKEEGTEPHAVNAFTANKNKNMRKICKKMNDSVRYRYLEHRCVQGTPQTVEMCLLYKKEGVPRVKPLSFIVANETESSVDLSWVSIPPDDQQGFVTHYALCHTKTNQPSQEHTSEECLNLTESQTKFRLANLKPDTAYKISLAGVTSAGPGPNATLNVNTYPKQPRNYFFVWISAGLMIIFFMISGLCSLLVKRFKNKIFPPIPEPILRSPLNGAANQEELEQKEQVDEVSVHQPVVDGKHQWFDEDMDIANTIIGTDEDHTQRGSRESFESPGDQEEVLYRNGLVFDMKAEED